jgi:hypothetical protein
MLLMIALGVNRGTRYGRRLASLMAALTFLSQRGLAIPSEGRKADFSF